MEGRRRNDKPPAGSADVARRMSRQATRDTRMERAVRSALHRAGYRFRVDWPVLDDRRRRRADVAFTRARVAVFVDGCFWHVCPEHATWPKHNAEWWREKLLGNVERDLDTDRRLRERGWSVIRIWEHEPADGAAQRVAAVVDARRVARRVATDRDA